MRSTMIVLSAALLFAGCIMPEPYEAVNDAPERATDANDRPCRDEERTLLRWTSGIENPVERAFEVPGEARTLDVEWTPPASATRPFRAYILDPDDARVFVREQGEGASAGPVALTLEETAVDQVRTPPKDGWYRFQLVSEGTVVGASLRVAATVCA